MNRLINGGILFALIAFSIDAKASTVHMGTIDPGPHLLGAIQRTPGIHLGLPNGQFGFGASVDVLGGAILSSPLKIMSPGIVTGPFIEINVIPKKGTTFTWGGRAGLGGLTPTWSDGFVPHILATFDGGRSSGAHTGMRMGGHLRSLYGGLGVNQLGEGGVGVTVGLEIPLVPFPLVC